MTQVVPAYPAVVPSAPVAPGVVMAPTVVAPAAVVAPTVVAPTVMAPAVVPQPTAVVVTQTVPATNTPLNGSVAGYKDHPTTIVCQHCGATVTTTIHYVVGIYTFFVIGIFLLVGLWLGCFLIPLFLPSCKDVVHDCPNCQNFVGKFCRYKF